MNDTATSAPGTSLLPDGIGAITTVHFVMLALVALLVIAAILWGAKLKRGRIRAHREVREHAAEAGVPVQAPNAPDAEAQVADMPADADPASVLPPEPAANVVAPDGLFDMAVSSPADGPVTQLKGLGPKVAAQLAAQGVTSVGQIAALDDDAAAALDARLGAFAGRMARDRWVEQARFLAAGDRAGFEAVFGKL